MANGGKGNDRQLFSIARGDVYCWAEQQSSVMLKSVTSDGDPVELSAAEVRLLAAELLRLADQAED